MVLGMEVNMNGEVIVFEGRIPMRAFHFSRGFWWLLLIGWNIGLIISFWKKLTHKIKISSQRIIFIQGLIAQREEEIEYFKVSDSKFEQSILGRIFGVGFITLWSKDRTAPYLVFPFVNPKKMREQIREGVRKERQKMKSIQID